MRRWWVDCGRMPGNGSNEKPWTAKGRLSAFRSSQVDQKERIRRLLAPKERAQASAPETKAAQDVVGIALQRTSTLRYRRTMSGDIPLSSSPISPLLDAVSQAIAVRTDNLILAWPYKPDNAFVFSAIHLLEGRLSKEHQCRTLALWPWRNAVTRSSQSILVEPDQLANVARAVLAGKGGKSSDDAQHGGDAYEMVHLRLADLKTVTTNEGSTVIVRLPSLLT